MRDPYEIFGLSKDASKEEFEARYKELKARYSADMTLPGEAGNDAARNLTEVESAWNIIRANLEKGEKTETVGGDFQAIDALIKEKRYEEAQAALDATTRRTAEWHYLQSIIYYRREWLTESRTQLQMAVDIEPWNEKYKTALSRLQIVMGNPQVDPNTIGRTDGMPPPQEAQQGGCGSMCSNLCCAYCLADCCCSMGRCCG